jgi:transaldolase
MLGGGARGLHHFTEMVGSEMHITINWKGTADRLIEQDPPVVHRNDAPTPQYVIDELLEKLPDFRRAYEEDGLNREDFADFGPVVLFRSMFVKGWDFLLDTIRKRRDGM